MGFSFCLNGFFFLSFRQMTMETVESQQDRSVTRSVAEHSSAHMQTGQISVPTLAQVGHRQVQ
jgi:hypothetical protein